MNFVEEFPHPTQDILFVNAPSSDPCNQLISWLLFAYSGSIILNLTLTLIHTLNLTRTLGLVLTSIVRASQLADCAGRLIAQYTFTTQLLPEQFGLSMEVLDVQGGHFVEFIVLILVSGISGFFRAKNTSC